MRKLTFTTTQRICQKIALPSQADGCWEWTGSRGRLGYGRILVNGTIKKAHRVVYQLFHGPIPQSKVCHHRCSNPSCVNPDHIELTSQSRHFRHLTPASVPSTNARKTHCKRGHPLTPDNLERWAAERGHRKCSICSREAEAAYRAKLGSAEVKRRAAERQRIYRERKRAKSFLHFEITEVVGE